MAYSENYDPLEGIAIIGMAGHFPEARNVDELWRNLLARRECISRFTADELEQANPEDMEVRENPAYVRARGVLRDADKFDERFFGFNPKEAEILDPQHRLFLQAAWEAFEHAGYDPQAFNGSIGVFAGATNNSYYLQNLLSRHDVTDLMGMLLTQMANANDYVATRVAYKFDLKGPALNIQNACSTSLVAVCTAVQSLQSYACDMALAGGVSVQLPQKRGYLYHEGSILSPDGHCRAFDKDAGGTVFSNGLGIVVLRRLRDALEDGDTIYAVIKGAALNNDGSNKVSFTAPSVDGHAQVISMAQALAGIDPSTISYIEAHGTGTALGDPIEIAGLTQAFRAGGATGVGYCAIGSVKTNIGHLDVAAGIAGLIKATLALHHKTLPASLNFSSPNPKLGIESTPFVVNATQRAWPEGSTPRRAGVSSFGVGGTNAHVVLEEAPLAEAIAPASRSEQLLLLSARDADSLERAAARLKAHLEGNAQANIADIAYTLQTGRRAFSHRRSLVCRSREDAIALLTTRDATRVHDFSGDARDTRVAFMFPGQGAQHANMGRKLYESEVRFRDEIDACAAVLKPYLGLDLRTVLYPDTSRIEEAQAQITQTAITQPALFAVEHALAQLWLSWGITPTALIGHSVGEYVAACLGGTFSRDTALSILAQRARLMQDMPSGSMLSVRTSEEALREYLGPRTSIAAINSPNLTVVSGDNEAIAELASALEAKGVMSRVLHTSHAFHSSMMEPVVGRFTTIVQSVERRAPTLHWISSLTGHPITDSEATDPAYWARQLREPVQFLSGISHLMDPHVVLLEVGPGQALSTLARQNGKRVAAQLITTSLNPAMDYNADTDSLLAAAGQLWARGVTIDWLGLHGGIRRRRVALPTYPFKLQRRWVEPNTAAPPVAAAPTTIPSTLQEPAQAPMIDTRASQLIPRLQTLFAELSGMEASTLEPATGFLELGLDSLFLTQASNALQKQFGAKISIRALLEDCSTLDTLAARLVSLMPPETVVATPPAGPTVSAPAALPQRVQQVANGAMSADQGTLANVFAQQLAIMSRQLEMLGGAGALPAMTLSPPAVAAAPAVASAAPPAIAKAPAPANTATAVVPPPTTAFGPYRPPAKGPTGGLTDTQQRNLVTFIERYNRKTAGSKRATAANRAHLADPRSVAGFRGIWKEMVYPIVSVRSSGSHLWDVDGNDYVDVTNGFGMILFGHNPQFIRDAITKQLELGIEIGPQTPLAGEVSKLVCDMVGMERAAFCGTGSEAVTAAIRVARTVSGRDKIVMFTGAYHGIFDEVLVRPMKSGDGLRAAPIAPGIPLAMTDNVIVLDYGTPETLRTIKSLDGQIAAVLTEPVQSRRPDLQPREFLQELRQITAESDTALVFDEVVTGFRVHPGGAQALFGIKADIATYGKVIGGGLPIGMVAGSGKYLDALDGGSWHFGDDSAPEVGVTFFAGTFVRHPMALAAARAVLLRLKQEGPELQRGLNLRTTAFVERLRKCVAELGAPVQINHFTSWFCITFPSDVPLATTFFTGMRERGVHIWDGRPCFLTLAHSEADLEHVAKSFRETLQDMQTHDFLPGRAPATVESSPPATSLLPVDFAPFSDSREEALALSEPQREMYAVAQMGDDANCVYNQCFSLRLRGPLSEVSLQNALQQVVRRHAALRTRIVAVEERQIVLASVDSNLTLIDLRELATSDREAAIRNLLDTETHTPFDLTIAPLWRAKLVRESADLHCLIVTAHHLVVDGWSSAVLFSDLAKAYVADRFGLDARLPQAAAYDQFIADGLSTAALTEAHSAEDYWVSQFASGVPTFELPFDRPRPPRKTYNAGRQLQTIEPSLYQAVRKMGTQHGATLFATLLAAYEVLLARLSSSEDLVIGIPMASQALQENGHLVAHGVNTIPLRSKIDPQRSFIEHLRDTRKSLLDAQAHQRLTFGSLVQRLKLPRDPSRNPLVSVIFNIDKLGAPFDFGEVSIAGIETPKAFYNFELGINAIDDGTKLVLECDYNSDLLNGETVARWLRHYRELLATVATNPGMRVADLPLPESERRAVLEVFNATEKAYPRETRVQDLFEEQVRRDPGAVALICESQSVTYAELNSRANQLARFLRDRRIGPDQLVGICIERSVEMVVGLLGILKAGGAYVPLDPGYPPERLQYMLSDAAPRVLLTKALLRERLPPNDAEVIALDEQWDDEIARQPSDDLDATELGLSSHHLAYVIYTSGSTGRPKGAMNEHRGVVNRLRWMQDQYQLGSADRVLQKTPFSFDVSVWEFFWTLMSGARLIVARPEGHKDPDYLRQSIEATGVTTLHFVPSMLQIFLEQHQAGACPSLRHIVCSGEALPATLQRKCFQCFPHVQLSNLYGPTEAAVDVTVWECDREDQSAQVPIGRPISNIQMYILDRHLRPVALGVVAEIYIGGIGVGRGYLKRPELTAERFIKDPFSTDPQARLYKTGDLGRWRADGNIEYLGRNDSQVKIRGFRIELGEIEAAIAQHPGVRQVAVIDREDVPGEKRLVAYLVASQAYSQAQLVQELRERLRQGLPDYMTPAHFLFVPALILTPNGKLDRKALPAPASTDPRSSEPVEPRTATEKLVVAAFADVLNRNDVGVHDNFFDLGGHSLMAARVMARIRNTAKVDLPLRNLFERPTPESLAAAIDALAWTAGGVEGKKGGSAREEIEL